MVAKEEEMKFTEDQRFIFHKIIMECITLYDKEKRRKAKEWNDTIGWQ
jgi:hypothetical protein